MDDDVRLRSRILTIILSFQIGLSWKPTILSAFGSRYVLLSLFYPQYKINRIGLTDLAAVSSRLNETSPQNCPSRCTLAIGQVEDASTLNLVERPPAVSAAADRLHQISLVHPADLDSCSRAREEREGSRLGFPVPIVVLFRPFPKAAACSPFGRQSLRSRSDFSFLGASLMCSYCRSSFSVRHSGAWPPRFR
jgi:hypothetical protein